MELPWGAVEGGGVGERRDTDPETSFSVPCCLTAFIQTETKTT